MQRLVIATAQMRGQTLFLTTEQQHYLTRVLRLGTGDRFLALDGEGHAWLATLEPDSLTATLSAFSDATIPLPQKTNKPWITLAACLPKQGFDEVVRQVTELGVDSIVPILSDRTVLKPSAHKLQRWRRIACEAAEQSERLTVPKISEPLAWSHWLQEELMSDRWLCVARRETVSLMAVYLATQAKRVVVAVGPEGGWTDIEITKAVAVGYQPVTLGKGVLRTVTAAVTALSILHTGEDFASMKSN
ncbi:MAG: 16S rRNA (uracil(1498)-N(3))-methyltransferase [Cyanobacteria bacterium P01_H01_bin.58]